MSYARDSARLARTGIPAVNTAQSLRALESFSNDPPEAVQTLGSLVLGDGGGGLWWWSTTSEAVDDGENVLTPVGQIGPGRWLRIIEPGGGGGTTLHANLTDTDTDGHPGSVVTISGGTTGNAVSIAADGSLQDAGTPPGGTGTTNLTNTPSATEVTVESSSGTDTSISAATGSAAGVLVAADKTKLDNAPTNTTTAISTAVSTHAAAPTSHAADVSQVEAEAGTEASRRWWSPVRVWQAITAWATATLGTAAYEATTAFDAAGTAAGVVTTHEEAGDPHTQYLTATEGNAVYATTAQGALADSSVQPGDDADTLGSGAATDGQLLTSDGLGGAAWEAAGGGGGSGLHADLTDTATDGHPGDVITIAGGIVDNAVSIAADGSLQDSGTPPGGSGTTNLSNTPSATEVTLESSSGTNTSVTAATDSVAGVMIAADKSKLDDIANNATADQSNAEIKTAYESNPDTNAFTDAEQTLLSNQSGANTGDEAASSTTVAGIVELATATEVDTGTDATRAISPDALADSAYISVNTEDSTNDALQIAVVAALPGTPDANTLYFVT